MAYRAGQLAGLQLKAGSAAAFSDKAQIADYAVQAVEEMQAAGIINGMSNQAFAPKGHSTRAQAAKVIYSVMSMLE
ncbi:Endo-1,4-beta-xylanase A precursor [compost metagenome]